MSFDVSTIAAQLAALVARCDDQQFALTSAFTIQLDAGHEFQSMFTVHPLQSRQGFQWSAVYRGRPVTGLTLIVNDSDAALGQAAALTSAAKTLDELDLRASSFGANPNPYDPRKPLL